MPYVISSLHPLFFNWNKLIWCSLFPFFIFTKMESYWKLFLPEIKNEYLMPFSNIQPWLLRKLDSIWLCHKLCLLQSQCYNWNLCSRIFVTCGILHILLINFCGRKILLTSNGNLLLCIAMVYNKKKYNILFGSLTLFWIIFSCRLAVECMNLLASQSKNSIFRLSIVMI